MKRAPVKILPRYTMSITGFLACAFGESFFRLSFAASRIRFPERSGSFFFRKLFKTPLQFRLAKTSNCHAGQIAVTSLLKGTFEELPIECYTVSRDKNQPRELPGVASGTTKIEFFSSAIQRRATRFWECYNDFRSFRCRSTARKSEIVDPLLNLLEQFH